MNDPAHKRTAAELRREFDEAFARPMVIDGEVREELLAIRAGDHDLALRSSEVAAILRCPTLTQVPSAHAALRGLAGVRGALVAVYALASLLGPDSTPARAGWIVLCREERSAALLFDDLVGHVRVAQAEIHAAASAAGGAIGAGELVEIAGVHRAVPSVPALLEIIRGTARGRD
jgi:chemotaxis signal transduction protein